MVIINKKRIRSIDRYLKGIQPNQEIIVALPYSQDIHDKLIACGFSEELAVGESVLPSIVGPVTQFNSAGKYLIHKDKPMETVYHQIEWTWQEYHGPYERVERTDVAERPYKRYPRTYIEPFAVELTLATDSGGRLIIISPTISYAPENKELLLHVINMYLEIFNECHVSDTDLKQIMKAPTVRLNWEILPRGKKPWSELKPLIDSFVATLPKSNQYVINKRLEHLYKFEPDFQAVGRAGFSGYLVFGFEKKNLYILESTQTNNATYVIDKEWEYLSSLTKAELLNNNLHKDRVIHRKNWFAIMNELLSE